MSENKAKNIPQLTSNQTAVIYKLMWYQDGYEQPSEDDLKRIMNVSILSHLNFFIFFHVINLNNIHVFDLLHKQITKQKRAIRS